MSTNPNNCAECDHHKTQRGIEAKNPNEQKLHCYMFKDVPTDVCMQHSLRNPRNFLERLMKDMHDGKLGPIPG